MFDYFQKRSFWTFFVWQPSGQGNFVPKDNGGHAILKLPCPIDLFPQIGLSSGRIDDFCAFSAGLSHYVDSTSGDSPLVVFPKQFCMLRPSLPSIHPFISLTPCLSLRAHTQILSLFLINKHPAPPKSDYDRAPHAICS